MKQCIAVGGQIWLWAIYIMAISRNIFWIAFLLHSCGLVVALFHEFIMNMDLLGRMSMENSMSQMDMPDENISQMSGDGYMAPMKGMNFG
ncbi:MAG: hypothetical protein CM15mP85_11300 [Rhodobacterales bacterium]|nr:MAG: hypothetical protein CM15mP85_11300 [Rhodobacterales bacterium]